MWAYSLKNRENRNFWYKFAPKRKFRGSMEKDEYRCTTTNLPLCNDAIIVLKITLLHSVSVITNFVITKRDKQTDRQKTSHFSSTAGARPTIPTLLGMVIEEVRPIFAPPNFFDPISSFAARAFWNFEGKCPHRGKMLITWLFVTQKQRNQKLKSYL